MKYNLDWIKKQYISESRIKYLFFWGHRPSKDGNITASCLSQWWPCQFVVDDILYKSTEHWMMAAKAKLFGDEEHWKKIIDCDSPAKAKKLGRKVKGFNDGKWKVHRYEIVKNGNFYKFSQNENLKNFLLDTQNRVLAEASPVDNIWGIGLAKTDNRANNPNKWKGLNLLGFALMEVRERIENMM